MTLRRHAGILLHPTSLPGSGGIGTLGNEALSFLSFAARAGCSVWQVLPLTPPAAGNSPYSAYSVFAGNPLLIDLHQLVSSGHLAEDELAESFPVSSVDYKQLTSWKLALLSQAANRFFRSASPQHLEEFWHFCDTTYWLHDYALFQSLKTHYKQRPWIKWPRDLVQRCPQALEAASSQLGNEIGVQKYQQWQFYKQWQQIKDYARQNDIEIIGDLPIFVAHDSADVWCNQSLFLLDQHGKPTEVAGVPPDYFSSTGQLWGNPLYNWQKMSEDGYAWWMSRLKAATELYDLIRIDHFRGFEAAWHVPAEAKSAIHGYWQKGPGASFFEAAQRHLGSLPFIAEDLGIITPEVEHLRDQFQLPGMKILQFAFGSDASNPYLPHNHTQNSIVYTGTHDNDTSRGWFQTLPQETITTICQYMGATQSEQPVYDLIRAAYMSVSRYAIIPLQDLLNLGTEARMNRPGEAFGNWEWRFSSDLLTDNIARQFRIMAERYGRA